ncbi:MAG: Flp1 family type IVb pilin [Lachnospiraceae bacterium]|nr:Flp1 family type IVb pilin [Lachnospiraceae bacterium]
MSDSLSIMSGRSLKDNAVSVYYRGYAKCLQLKQDLRDTLKNEDGMGVVEVVLITIVLISLVIIFRKNIQEIVSKALERATKGAGSIDTGKAK